jgi:hypothetical protein
MMNRLDGIPANGTVYSLADLNEPGPGEFAHSRL